MVYTPKQRKSYARNLKKHQTAAEQSLKWLYLLGFRPQVVTPSNYVADWYHKRSRVAVELDGYPHTTKFGRASDRRRDKHHQAKGIITIRVRNEMALNHKLLTGFKIVFISLIWQLWQWFGV
jgi:very-short-patch-repair endonuclease